jgi:hypothetical protein
LEREIGEKVKETNTSREVERKRNKRDTEEKRRRSNNAIKDSIGKLRKKETE